MTFSTKDTASELQSRILRFEEFIPCKTAFIDARTPGSDQKENFCLIGGGVAENPGQVIHINIPHGFDIGGARQPHGCKNSHHSHDTEEVFVVHKGEWKFTWGHDGSDGEVILKKGDTISIPTGMFRGFENVGPDDGFLFSVLGQNKDGSAGHVIWAPYVYKEAKHHGLVLLDDGRLIDTANGEVIPENSGLATPSTDADLVNFKTLSKAEFLNCVAFENEVKALAHGGLSSEAVQDDDVQEIAIIGVDNNKEKIAAGKMAWPHGFQLRRLRLKPDATINNHSRAEEEVLFVHAGELQITTPDLTFTLNTGDLFTCPIDTPREYKNTGKQLTDIIVVRRGDHPEGARFL